MGRGFFYAPSFIHQHRSHCNIRSCILRLLLKQLVCKETLPNFLILFFMLFSPSRLGRETSRLSFPPHFPVKPRKSSREDTHLFKENWFCWEFHAVGWNIPTDSWKWLTSSRALVHQLRGSFELRLPQKGEQVAGRIAQPSSGSAPLRQPIAAICSGTGGLKDGCETSACSPPALLIAKVRDKTSGDGPANGPEILSAATSWVEPSTGKKKNKNNPLALPATAKPQDLGCLHAWMTNKLSPKESFGQSEH